MVFFLTNPPRTYSMKPEPAPNIFVWVFKINSKSVEQCKEDGKISSIMRLNAQRFGNLKRWLSICHIIDHLSLWFSPQINNPQSVSVIYLYIYIYTLPKKEEKLKGMEDNKKKICVRWRSDRKTEVVREK